MTRKRRPNDDNPAGDGDTEAKEQHTKRDSGILGPPAGAVDLAVQSFLSLGETKSHKPVFPDAPESLGARGSEFWRQVRPTMLDRPKSGDLELMCEVCNHLDELADLHEAWTASGPLAAGSKGQPRPSPLGGELRQHRAALLPLLEQLKYSVDLDAVDKLIMETR